MDKNIALTDDERKIVTKALMDLANKIADNKRSMYCFPSAEKELSEAFRMVDNLIDKLNV